MSRAPWKESDNDLGTPECGTPTLINPTSSLLQGLLKEERAHRGSRGMSEDGAESPRTPDRPRVQEDTASEKARRFSQFSAANAPLSKEMGVREMDQVWIDLEH